ncbi:Gfo/Idh/MocA family oxidoreductase [Paeniglutamicibacter sp. ABSL32-1]|uniref:NAD(P)H-dependent oxidoreductase n=1 Tax=Paeniglutamicibacter quisquiliarum TaxID=2849498 RepID=UPI001C2D2A2A|nr:Gfo/Idh/MocA family oxidoreductase [Paeniglutamicibacter quisquiliarum]MBV1781060.1 Gfo/Idh/MocA family oxidoreductase [Paeniglutamicibacter quisquiliarum]
MNLHSLLQKRHEAAGPIRVGVIGAGKFASMFLTQAVNMPELHIVAIADIAPTRAFEALERTGWPRERYGSMSIGEAAKSGRTAVIDDSAALVSSDHIEVVLEVTGNPLVGVTHAIGAIDNGKHIIMVNVEADCLVGPLLRQRADRAGVVYSMAYGDQPALIAEMVDWCRTVGYEVTAAGKGTKYLPEYRYSTPDTVWDYYGFTEDQLAHGDFNPKMFNSFLDGTKSAIEMAAVSNACGLVPAAEGLQFPVVSVDELSDQMVPRSAGGTLEGPGMVEVISSLNRDGSEVERDLRWGVYVTFRAQTEYARSCFSEYGVRTDKSGWYGSLYRPYHMIGMELGVSVASAVLRGEATGAPVGFSGDVVTMAKRDLRAGETLDGEGGYCVTGTLAPASVSLAQKALPMGLSHNAKLVRNVAKDHVVTWDDVELPEDTLAVQVRREMEAQYQPVGA